MRAPLAGLAVLLLMSPAYAAAPRTHVVVIDKMKFGPVPKLVRPGDTIIWVNRDMFRHTATARNGSFNVDLPANSRGKSVIRAKGALPFYCKYHPAMTGTLKVSN
jgi:plastocyanin